MSAYHLAYWLVFLLLLVAAVATILYLAIRLSWTHSQRWEASELARKKLERQMDERMRSEAALRAGHEELASIHASAPVVLLTIDRDLRVQKDGDLAARFAGQTIKSVDGLTYCQAIDCLKALDDPAKVRSRTRL